MEKVASPARGRCLVICKTSVVKTRQMRQQWLRLKAAAPALLVAAKAESSEAAESCSQAVAAADQAVDRLIC